MADLTPDQMLEEWGRWARSGDPMRIGHDTPWPDGAPIDDFPAYEEWRPTNEREPGWGDYDAVPRSPLPPIDEKRAQQTDRLIMELGLQGQHDAKTRALSIRHVIVIKRIYYNRTPLAKVGWERLDAARRAFADLVLGPQRIAA